MSGRQIKVNLELDASAFTKAMTNVAKELDHFAAAVSRWAAALALKRAVARIRELDALARHQPVPLSIDGHAYRRRQRARTRRRRS